MAQDSTGKNESTTILVRFSALVAISTTTRLQLAFPVPSAGAVAAFCGIGIAALHMHERNIVEGDASRAQMLVEGMYRDDVVHNAQSLEVAKQVVGHDAALHEAKAGGRNRPSRYELALGQAEVQG